MDYSFNPNPKRPAEYSILFSSQKLMNYFSSQILWKFFSLKILPKFSPERFPWKVFEVVQKGSRALEKARSICQVWSHIALDWFGPLLLSRLLTKNLDSHFVCVSNFDSSIALPSKKLSLSTSWHCCRCCRLVDTWDHWGYTCYVLSCFSFHITRLFPVIFFR